MSAFEVKHLTFCIEEMLVEVDEQLTRHELVRALAQLDTREARGETLDVVCPKALRAHLQREIGQLPATRARHKLLELSRIVNPGTDTAAAPDAAAASETPIVDFVAYRAAKAVPAPTAEAPRPAPAPAQPKKRVRVPARVARAAATASAFAMLWMASPQLIVGPSALAVMEAAAPSIAERLGELLPYRAGLVAACW